LFADPSGGKGETLTDENGCRKFDDNGNYIPRSDRVPAGEVSMSGYGSGGSTVEKMISKINGLSDAKKAILPPPHILLQLLMAEESSGGNWEKLFRGMSERIEAEKKDILDGEFPIQSDFKNYFKFKLLQFDALYRSVSPFFRSTFDAAEFVGGGGEVIGLVAAPFTGSASLILVGPGADMSAVGTVGNVLMDLYEEKDASASYRLSKFLLTGGMGKFLEKIPFKRLYFLIASYVKVLETVVLPAIEDSYKKFVLSSKLKL
jgi:hypothetical protein